MSDCLPSIVRTMRTVFSLGDYRRNRIGSAADLPADYFHPTERSEESERLREMVKNEMMDVILTYLQKDGGQVAIYDANNTTIAERRWLRDVCEKNDV
jgi:6-phosphofructo-2-kinase/fructose-2,6-biphosphatase 4